MHRLGAMSTSGSSVPQAWIRHICAALDSLFRHFRESVLRAREQEVVSGAKVEKNPTWATVFQVFSTNRKTLLLRSYKIAIITPICQTRTCGQVRAPGRTRKQGKSDVIVKSWNSASTRSQLTKSKKKKFEPVSSTRAQISRGAAQNFSTLLDSNTSRPTYCDSP